MKEATCIEAGYLAHYTCSRCDETFDESYQENSSIIIPVKPLNHNYEKSNEQASTCKTQGFIAYECTLCNDIKKDNLELSAHDYGTLNLEVPATCNSDGRISYYECSVCEKTFNETLVEVSSEDLVISHDNQHNYVIVENIPASCLAFGSTKKVCTRCNNEINDTIDALGHDYKSHSSFNENTCLYSSYKECSRCHDEIEKTEEYRHQFISSIKTNPTCSTNGELESICKVCNHSDISEILKDTVNGHNFEETGNGKECTLCEETIIEVDGSDVSIEDLSGNTVIKNENASIMLDENTKNQLVNQGVSNIAVSVGTIDKDKDEVFDNLNESYKELIGDNPVYDFSMMDGENAITNFGGMVTISLPYTIKDGDDYNAITIWYINDQGQVERINGTYSNGFVTFETNHFSLYTISKLTNEEMCEKYGHNIKTIRQAATCEADGSYREICLRCNKELVNEVVSKYGHDLLETRIDPKCGVAGSLTSACRRCDYSSNQTLSALEHNYVVVRVEKATCTDEGTRYYECILCNDRSRTERINALGHNLVVTYTFSDDYYNCNLELSCTRCDYNYNGNMLVEYTEELPTCLKPGKGNYIATAVVDGITYSTTKNKYYTIGEHNYQLIEAKDPTCKDKGIVEHYKCSDCGRLVDNDKNEIFDIYVPKTNNHIYSELIQGIAPTCKDTGRVEHYKCTVCNKLFDTSYLEISSIIVNVTNNHEYGDLHEALEATCKDDGHIAYYQCDVCNKIFNEEHVNVNSITIPKNDLHTPGNIYKYDSREHYLVCTVCNTKLDAESHITDNNICTVCGYDSSVCDHELKQRVLSYKKEFGTCEEATITYFACDCGKYQDLMELDFFGELNCLENVDFTRDEVEIDGVKYDRISRSCDKCGLQVVSMYNFSGCDDIRIIILTGSNGNTITFKDDSNGEKHHNRENTIKDTITFEGSCGFEINIEKCKDCDDIIYFEPDMDNTRCKFEMSGDKEHQIAICSVCGLTLEATLLEERTVSCFYKLSYIIDISLNGISLYHYVEVIDRSYEHDIEESYEFLNEDIGCDAGVVIHSYCKTCESRGSRLWDGHWDKEFNYDSCYPQGLSISACRFCGYIEDLREPNFCKDGTLSEENHSMVWYSESCGLKFMVTSTIDKNKCGQTIYTIEISRNNELLGTFFTIELNGSTHEFNNDIVFNNGVDCRDGYVITSTCSICSTILIKRGYGHDVPENGVTYLYTMIDGYCNKYDVMYECQLCKKQLVEFDSRSHIMTVSNTNDNEVTLLCVKCNIEIIVSKYKYNSGIDRFEEGSYYGEDAYIVIDGNRIALSHTRVYLCHNYRIDVTFNKENGTCNDGYTIHYTCESCNYSYTDSGYGHHYEYVEKEIKDDSVCYGSIYLYIEECRICHDTRIDFKHSCKLDAKDDSYSSCIECGLVVERILSSTNNIEACKNINNYVFTIKTHDNTVLFNKEYSQIESDHNLKRINSNLTCDGTSIDGYICEKCGYFDCMVINLNGCNLEKVVDDINLISFRCTDCNLVISRINNDYFSCYEEHKIIIEISGIEQRLEFNRDSHICNVSYKLVPGAKSCDDGVNIIESCLFCNKIDRWSSNSHQIATQRRTFETTHGLLTVEVGWCKACDYKQFWNDSGCEFDNVSLTNELRVYECSCGVTKTIRLIETETEGCNFTRKYEYIYTMNDEVIFKFTSTLKGQNHDYVYTPIGEVLDCSNGYKAIVSCNNCDYSDEIEFSHHKSIYKTTYEIQGHNDIESSIQVSTCACGKDVGYTFNGEKYYSRDYTSYRFDSLKGNELSYLEQYDYTCLITDPLCGYTMHVEYTLGESLGNCLYRNIMVLYFDYNEDTHTYSDSIQISLGTSRFHKDVILDTYTEEIEIYGVLNVKRYSCQDCNAYVIVKQGDGYYEHFSYQNGITFVHGNKCLTSCESIRFNYQLLGGNKINYNEDIYTGHSFRLIDGQEPTCTQYGNGRVCTSCGFVDGDSIKPLGHSFEYNVDTGMYECIRCNLKSPENVSGNVVFENMSNDDIYIAGYYIVDPLSYKYVVVIVDGENEIVTDINAESIGSFVYIYKYNIEEFISNNNISSDYKVKLSFVPKYADTDLIYSITF